MENLGAFNVTSGKIRVTDPCYTKDTWCAGVVENCKNGVWEAIIEKVDEGAWGIRVASLTVSHRGSKPFTTSRSKIIVGVDSGQAGFFDESEYPEGDPGEYSDVDSFYGKCCRLTTDIEANSRRDGGTLPFGVVSPTGYGDGSYSLDVSQDIDGNVVEMKITFIGDEEEYDDEWESEEDEE